MGNGASAPNDKNVFFISFANTDGGITYCSAVLVTPTRLLTAAHCINGEKSFPFVLGKGQTGPYMSGSAIRIQSDLSVPTKDQAGQPQPGDVASYTPDPAFPAFVPVAYAAQSPMDFSDFSISEFDLAVVPLDRRIRNEDVPPAVLPFDAAGQLNPCGAAFNGRFVGYGTSYVAAFSSYDRRYAGVRASRGPSYAFGDTYRTSYSVEDLFANAFSELPGIGQIGGSLLSQALHTQDVHLIEGGDSGGPLFQGSKLCGLTSALSFSDVSCEFKCTFELPPVCGVFCGVALDNVWARVDSDAAPWLQANLVDERGHFHGTCGGDAPPGFEDIDSDADGIPDGCDPCPYSPDANYIKTGHVTTLPDADGDGVPDFCDNCPGSAANPYQVDGDRLVQPDSDGDGLGDACDNCDNRQRQVADHLHNYSDFVCCSSDADCGNPGHNAGWSSCVPVAPSGSPGLGGILLDPCPDSGKVCSKGVDSDGDGWQDTCDNCPGTRNPGVKGAAQLDSDDDGVGDECDNCRGDEGQHPEDRNDYEVNPVNGPPLVSMSMACAPSGFPDAAGDAYCQSINPEGRCVPGKVAGGTLLPSYCSKFADPDGDDLGDACDSCRNVANPKHGYDLQPNCNVDSEVAAGHRYPWVGDACDPNPCSRDFEKGGTYAVGTDDEIWVGFSLEPQLVPKGDHVEWGYAQNGSQAQTTFNRGYTTLPKATVGGRFCDCVLGTVEVPTVQGCALTCGLDNARARYDVPVEWRKTSLVANPNNSPAPTGVYQHGDAPFTDQLSSLSVELPWDAAQASLPPIGQPNLQLSSFGSEPVQVWWDVSADGAAPHDGWGALNKGLIGVFWSHVRNVPQMQAASVDNFRALANHYAGGYFGRPKQNVNGSLVGQKILSCGELCDDPCPTCRMFPDAKSMIVQPVSLRIVVASATGGVDVTSQFPDGFSSQLVDTTITWTAAAERGDWVRPGQSMMAATSADGSSVQAVMALQDGAMRNLVGLRPRELVAGAALDAAVSPAPRSGHAVVLSGVENALFVIGGEGADGGELGDVWKYSLDAQQWSPLSLDGPAPQHVLAATYRPEDRSLYVVDEVRIGWARLARLLRLDPHTGRSTRLGLWPRTPFTDEVFLSNGPLGRLLLSGSSRRLRRTTGVLLDIDGGRGIIPVWGFTRTVYLGLEPTLSLAGLTLPVAVGTDKVKNTFIRWSDLHADRRPRVDHCL